LLQNRSDFERELEKHQRHAAAYLSQRTHLGAMIQAEVNRTNPYMQEIAVKKDRLNLKQTQLKTVSDLIDRYEKDRIAVNFWITGFKRVRLFLVEQTLRQLEVEVNNNMASLGLNDYRIEFDVERENKSGGVTKGFTVLVYSPDHDKPVRWEAWGGGVTHRLRLAGDLGLANLIMERAGLTGSVEFYDEPSRHLSQEGLLDVAETLHQRALTGNKRVFLVDHASIDFGDFAGCYFITKTADGSQIGR
jgi:DNA repair exonuclease SbcCD ATPase subunit